MKQKLFTLLTLLCFAVSGAWADVATLSESLFIQTYSAKVGSSNPTLSDLTTDFPAYLATYNSPATANGSGCSSTVTTPYNFSTNVASATKYWRIKCGNGKGFKITDVKNIKKIHLYGNGASSTRTVTAAATGGTLADGAKVQQSFANSSTTIVDYTFDISSLANYSSSDAYTITITPDGDIHVWGIYLEASVASPSISAADASITATESGVEATQGIAVTGSNLKGSTLTATLSPAVDGLSVDLASSTITDGAISTTATLHYTKTANAKGTTTLVLSDGTTTKNVKVTYKANITPWTLQSISEATTWDFTSKVSGEKQYTTDEDKATEHVYANIDGLTYSDGFNAEALAFTGEYPFRSDSKKYAQNGCFRMITTVPGTLKFTFSNTGSSNKNRYLKVNSQNGTVEADGTANRTEIFGVPAGEIIVKNVSGDDFTTLSALCYKKIEFVPTEDGDAVSVTSAGYASVVLANDAYFAATPSVTAYAAKANKTTITLTAVSKAPAGTPLIIKAAEDDYTLQKGGDGVDSPAAVSASINDLEAGPVTDSDGTNYYVLGKEGSKVGFGLLADGVNLPATKAYIAAGKFAEARSFFAFDEDGETTGITNINSKREFNGEFYNLAGQKVANPTKGLYIVNGKKVIIK